METIATIFGILGIGIIPVLYVITNIIFKHNIEFREILKTFPEIAQDRINKQTKTTIEDISKIEISKEFTDFVDKEKRGKLDEFLVKLEKFDESKLKFKKKEISVFIHLIKRNFNTSSNKITIDHNLNITEIKPYEWTAFNYLNVHNVFKSKQKDKIYINNFTKKYFNF